MRPRFISFAIFFFWLSSQTAFSFEVKNLSSPESFIADRETGEYYISNISGGPLQKNGIGFITRLQTDGSVFSFKFVEGGRDGAVLNAPKGLAISGDTIWVADIDHLRGFDRRNGRPVADLDISPLGARFLNDVAVAEGVVYVTDMSADRIFRYNPAGKGEVEVFASMKGPNGIKYIPGRKNLVVVTWTGQVFFMGMDGRYVPASEREFGNLDGVDVDDAGNIFFSDFSGGVIWKMDAKGDAAIVAEGLETPADIALDVKKKILLVPSLAGGRVFTLPY